ncbi:MAG: hypothetical protein J2P21_29240 [Chloracidobacterium sp.]|nr:hypothetical protein [Chloracidobacterium sp.]
MYNRRNVNGFASILLKTPSKVVALGFFETQTSGGSISATPMTSKGLCSSVNAPNYMRVGIEALRHN